MSQRKNLYLPTEVLLLTAQQLGPWDLIRLARAVPGLGRQYRAKYWVPNRDENGNNILHLAASHGVNDIVSSLLRRPGSGGEYLSTQNDAGFTALHKACQGGHADAARLLLEHGVDPNIVAKGGITALHLAASMGDVELTTHLIRVGASLCARTEGEYTVLHWATVKRQPEIAALLLQAGADLECRDTLGWSPLHWAAHQGDTTMVEQLLQSGADPHVEDIDGSKPSDLAFKRGYLTVALRLRCAELELRSASGYFRIAECIKCMVIRG